MVVKKYIFLILMKINEEKIKNEIIYKTKFKCNSDIKRKVII